jgi:hypothetical protein
VTARQNTRNIHGVAKPETTKRPTPVEVRDPQRNGAWEEVSFGQHRPGLTTPVDAQFCGFLSLRLNCVVVRAGWITLSASSMP